jgi:hypothetical protein
MVSDRGGKQMAGDPGLSARRRTRLIPRGKRTLETRLDVMMERNLMGKRRQP